MLVLRTHWRILPLTNAPNIDVDEVMPGIVAYSTKVKFKGRIAQV